MSSRLAPKVANEVSHGLKFNSNYRRFHAGTGPLVAVGATLSHEIYVAITVTTRRELGSARGTFLSSGIYRKLAGDLIQFVKKTFGPYRLHEMQLKAGVAGALLVVLPISSRERDQLSARGLRVIPYCLSQNVTVAVR
jgi:hypothetical protein